MSANILFDLLSLAVQAQFDCVEAPPVLLIGQCGVGKGRGYVRPIAKGLTKTLVEIYLPRHDAAELNGYPYANDETKTMQHYAAHWAHQIQHEIDPKNTVLFIDEASDAPRSTQAAAHGFLTDGIVGECSVKGCAMILAMNPPNISTTGGTISHGLGNRVFHIDVQINAQHVIRQMKVGKWDVNEVILLPKGWTKGIQASEQMVGAFLENFDHHLLITESDLEKRGEDVWKPAHTPRSWEFFWVLRAAAIASGQEHLMHAIAMGTVGEPGVEYLAWEKDLEFGDPEVWLATPSAQPFPQEDDRAFAIINAVMSAVLRDNTAKRWTLGWEFLEYCYNKQAGDIAVHGSIALARNRPQGAKGIPNAAKLFLPMLREAGVLKKKKKTGGAA